MAMPALCSDPERLMAMPRGLSGGRREGAGWRTYEVSTSVTVLKPVGETRVWLPQPLAEDTVFQQTLSNSVRCEGKTFVRVDRANGLRMLGAVFPAGTDPVVMTTCRVRTRDWSVDLDGVRDSSSTTKRPFPASAIEFLKPTEYVPTDGIVKEKAHQITQGAETDVEKTHAIYEWVVQNTYRNPKVRGCGEGDIRPMLESGDLGGKCADLNALFVGLVKASGVPARDVYGIRVGPSTFGYSSLGASSNVISKAQHCRAEVYLTEFGWVPMDPADVRKVILEEPPGHLALTNRKVESARKRLFGSWEMNWMAYNYAQDVALPGSSAAPLHFFMYPQAETAEGRLDSLDPQSFRYEITSHELSS